jgi:hypothetical protein
MEGVSTDAFHSEQRVTLLGITTPSSPKSPRKSSAGYQLIRHDALVNREQQTHLSLIVAVLSLYPIPARQLRRTKILANVAVPGELAHVIQFQHITCVYSKKLKT